MLYHLNVFIWLFIWFFCICFRSSNSRRWRDVHDCARRRVRRWSNTREYEQSVTRQAPLWSFLLLFKFLSLKIHACDDDFYESKCYLCRVDTSYFNAFTFLDKLYPLLLVAVRLWVIRLAQSHMLSWLVFCTKVN